LWAELLVGIEERKLGGRSMTALEARRLRRKLGGLAAGGSEKGGRYGPPNLGVWFGAF
jgi:hypothetical protein